MLYTGNTVKVTCQVRDFNDELIDPAEIKLRIYDEKYNLLNEYTSIDKNGIGNYAYTLTLPETAGAYILEWYASIESYPFVKRKLIRIAFV